VSSPVPTFLPKDNSNNNASTGFDIAIKSETPSMDAPGKVWNRGGDTCSNDSQKPLEQGLEGVPTSPERGGDTSVKLEKVTDEDAQAMRDIALKFWSTYYPEHIQSLMTQMYGRQAPGTRYEVAILTEWLQGEDDLTRDRLTELIRLRKG
jgi:hypothetical protein